jgi:serine/threonine-protein kinase HipA
MAARREEKVRVARVWLGDVLAGHIAGYVGGRNIFVFDPSYIARGPARPSLGLAFNIPGDEARTQEQLNSKYSSSSALPSWFSNLLPEGALRDFVLHHFGLRTEQEFDLLMALGEDLVGAVRVTPDKDPPGHVLAHRDAIPDVITDPAEFPRGFSLAGVQLKFSMIDRNHRLTLPQGDETGSYIVKVPSPRHLELPLNEYASMRLAEAAGVVIPEIRLIDASTLEGVPEEFISEERQAFAIRRFDREGGRRIHAEDFAQVFGIRPQEKYGAVNYEQLARIIKVSFANSSAQLEKLTRRLVVNVLLGNADAHVKNFSVIYPDGISPELAPAYDIVSTIAYQNNFDTGLNQGDTKKFYRLDEQAWIRFAQRSGIPEQMVMHVLRNTVSKANDHWPGMLQELPMPGSMRKALSAHWKKLPDILRLHALT